MSQSYELEQVEIKKALPILKSKIDELKRQSDCADNFINVIKKYTIIDKLDAAILNELIDKIVVHHKEQAEDGRTFQQIEIYYRFVGKLGTENELSRRHNRANTAVTHEKSKYDMTSLYRQPMVVGSSPTIQLHRSVVCSLPSDPFVWVGGFIIMLAAEDMGQ